MLSERRNKCPLFSDVSNTGHDIQTLLKNVLQSDWCKQRGVVVVPGTSREEYWCPIENVVEVFEFVTRSAERRLGDDAIGCHQEWDARGAENGASAAQTTPVGANGSSVNLAVARFAWQTRVSLMNRFRHF